nr:hypothetical protein CFP56_67682 [Quercus suber]
MLRWALFNSVTAASNTTIKWGFVDGIGDGDLGGDSTRILMSAGCCNQIGHEVQRIQRENVKIMIVQMVNGTFSITSPIRRV